VKDGSCGERACGGKEGGTRDGSGAEGPGGGVKHANAEENGWDGKLLSSEMNPHSSPYSSPFRSYGRCTPVSFASGFSASCLRMCMHNRWTLDLPHVFFPARVTKFPCI